MNPVTGERPKDREPLPRGLVFFAPNTSKSRRLRRQIFVGMYLAIGSLVIWPVYQHFAEPFPLILGLPKSMAWIIFALVLMFLLLLGLFLTDGEER